jgi:hypothetical protein
MPNSNQVVVGSNGKIWVADIGVSAPTRASTAMPAGWIDLGYVTDDGATFTEGKDITDIGAWQSFFPVRRIVSSRLVTIAFSLEQWNNATIEFALGGAVAANAGEWTYSPPAPEVLDFRQVALEWYDQGHNYRLYVRKGLVSENVEVPLVRTGAALLPITFAAMDPGGGASVYSLFSDDAAFSQSS